MAEKEEIWIAFSNEVFELWLLLHLIDVSHEPYLSRAEVYQVLEEQIKLSESFNDFTYQHGKTNIIDAVIEIGDEVAAIRRAEELLISHGAKTPIDANPCTYVHLLVRHLRDLINWYSYAP